MIADLLEQLGGIAPGRVRLYPSPGTAVEQDVFDIQANEGRLFELVDGTLVETVAIYTSQDDPIILTQAQVLDGGGVLHGFSTLIKSLFDEVDQQFGTQSLTADK